MSMIPVPSRPRARRLLAAVCVAAALTATALPHAVAAADKTNRAVPAAPTALAATGHTFSAAGGGGTTVTVNANGTLTDFTSPTGFTHFTSPREGYMLCGNNIAFDFGNAGSAGFAAPTTTFANGVFSVVRKTADGLFRLTQDFTLKAGVKRLAIKMTVTNLSSSTRFVALRRQADFDVDSAGASRFAGDQNDFMRTFDSVVAWDDLSQSLNGIPHGMLLGHESATVGNHLTRVTTAGFDTAACDVAPVDTPIVTPADRGAAIVYHMGALAPNQSQSATVAYQRI